MKINDLIGVSGSINSGKDLVGEMLCYISQADKPTYKGFKHEVVLECPYEIKKCAEKLKEVLAIIIGCKRSDLEDEEFKNRELGEEWWVYKMDLQNPLNAPYPLITQKEYDALFKNQKEYLRLVKLTPRMMLQLLGTQGGRMIVHPNIWVNALFADYKPKYICGCDPYKIDSPGDIVTSTHYPKWIITDVRFPENEGVGVTQRNGLLIGIKRKFALKQPKYAYLIDGGRDEYKIPYELEELDNKLYKSLTHESELSMGDHSWCDVIIDNNGTIEELFNQVLKAVK